MWVERFNAAAPNIKDLAASAARISRFVLFADDVSVWWKTSTLNEIVYACTARVIYV